MTAALNRTAVKGWLSLLLLLLAGPVYGIVTMTPVSDIQLGFWNPALGSLTGSSTFCVLSLQGSGPSVRDYRVRATPLSSATFELINTLDSTQLLPFRMDFNDLKGASTEQLAVDAWSSRDKQSADSCAGSELNAEIAVLFDAIDLSQVGAGIYRATFSLVAGASGRAEDTFSIELTIGELVWIQRLDDIALGYVQGSDAVGDEPFCIWSSTAAYDITISSQTPTGSTTFVASGQVVAANTVDYSVQFDSDADASDGVAVTEGATLINQTTTASGSPPSCLGDNTALRIRFIEAGNLDAAPADTYQDQLILLIEPR
jgi:hypothetical protein